MSHTTSQASEEVSVVLVVDPDNEARRSTCEILEHQGFEVEEATSAGAAVGALQRIAAQAPTTSASESPVLTATRPTLVPRCCFAVVAMDSPSQQSDELVAALRSEQPQLPVLLTGQHVEQVVDRADLATGGFEFVAKPFTTMQFIDAARRMMARLQD